MPVSRWGATLIQTEMDVSELLLLVYRAPSQPFNNCVSVWRDLKHFDALFHPRHP
ncbi:MAG TPA: hypothetical protein VNM48_18610 [Chloroflexota bacterium]|nr:hypothetical protein [Chloroflexota bacterium]